MICPTCNSENTRKFSIAYEEGTTKSKSEGFSDNASHETEHFSQTSLAKRCSPPQEPTPGFALGIVGTVFSIWAALKFGFLSGSFWVGLVSFMVAMASLSIFWRRFLAKKSFATFDANYADWEKSWVCMKCGSTFLFDR